MSVFVAALLSTLCLAMELLLQFAPFSRLGTQKQKRTLWSIYALMLLVDSALLYWAINEGISSTVFARYNGILFGFVVVLVNILTIRGRTLEHLFVFGIVLTNNYLIFAIPDFIESLHADMQAAQRYILIELIYVALLLLIFYPMRLLLRRTVEPFLSLDSGNYWKRVWFIPLMLFLIVLVDMIGGGTDTTYDLVSRMAMAVLSIFICWSVAADHKHLHERQTLDEQLLRQKLHYSELQIKMEDARKARHDLKHHIAAIRHYIDMDDKEGLRAFCNDLIGEVETEAPIPYTGNATADGVMYHYVKLAEQKQIQFDYYGTIQSRSIADIDLCVLLGNALDNAVAGCMTIESGRSIRVISQTEEKLLSVVVSNSFDGKVQQAEGKILSRKRENRAGVGLVSMRSICERYGGSMQTQWDEHKFTVMFLLPLNDEIIQRANEPVS